MKLPEIAENVETAIVLNVLVSEGDHVEKDDPVAEMESEKATFDLPAEVSGTIKEITMKENDEVQVGQVVMTIDTEGEGKKEEEEAEEQKPGDGEEKKEEKEEEETTEKDKEKTREEKEEAGEEEKTETGEGKKTKAGTQETEAPEGEEEEQKDEGKAEQEPEEEAGEEIQEEAGEDREREVPASPSVRRLARELGVDIYKVEGTGPADRITTDDVKSFAKEIVRKSGDQAAAGYSLPDFSKWGETYSEEMDSIRKRTAKSMTGSWQSIPHVFQFDKADITSLEDFRKQHGKEVEKQDGKLTVTAILLKIVAEAMHVFPKFNASLDMQNGKIIFKKYVHIGVAVDTERGLLVPVIRDADKKSIVQLSLELGELAEKARNKKIKPDELQGGNFAISNLGGIGGTNFTPIVYRPNVAILGVSRAEMQPVYMDGEFNPRLIVPLSLSYDHRLIDGAEGARFLRWLCEALENPLLIMFKGGA